MKNITINEEVKGQLDKLKIHPRESYSDVIKRLLEFHARTSGC